MTDQMTKCIGFFRDKINSYYVELVNNIDVKTGGFLSLNNIQHHEKEVINAKRNRWIKRVELVRQQNIFNLEKNGDLEKLNTLKNDEEQLNYELFQNDFLIFTPHKVYYVDPLYFGMLIHKNGYVNKNVIRKFE